MVISSKRKWKANRQHLPKLCDSECASALSDIFDTAYSVGFGFQFKSPARWLAVIALVERPNPETFLLDA